MNRSVKGLFCTSLVLLSFYWLGRAVFQGYSDLKDLAGIFNVESSIYAVVSLVFSAYASAYLYYLLIKKNEVRFPGFRVIVQMYFASRLVRYLPGRLWLYVYQVNNLSSWISAKKILLIGFEEFFLVQTNTFFVFLTAFLLYNNHSYLSIIVYLCGIFVCFYIQKQYFIYHLVIFFERIIKNKLTIIDFKKNNVIYNYLIVTFLQVEWLFYLISWKILNVNNFNFADLLCLSSSYAVAWLIGFLSFVMPGGLIVREASFVWICINIWSYNQIDMVYYSVVMRLVFILSDIVSYFISILIGFLSLKNEGAY